MDTFHRRNFVTKYMSLSTEDGNENDPYTSND